MARTTGWPIASRSYFDPPGFLTWKVTSRTKLRNAGNPNLRSTLRSGLKRSRRSAGKSSGRSFSALSNCGRLASGTALGRNRISWFRDWPCGRLLAESFTKFADFFCASNAIQFNHLPAESDFPPPGLPQRVTYNVAWGGFARANRSEGSGFWTCMSNPQPITDLFSINVPIFLDMHVQKRAGSRLRDRRFRTSMFGPSPLKLFVFSKTVWNFRTSMFGIAPVRRFAWGALLARRRPQSARPYERQVSGQ